MSVTDTIYTIGYAGFPNIHDFTERLKEHKINCVIDVWANPYANSFG